MICDRCGVERDLEHYCLDALKAERDRLLLQVSELQKKLGQIKEAVCRECSGSGEIGLADGEVACPTCGGSGDPLKPGVFAKKRKCEVCQHGCPTPCACQCHKLGEAPRIVEHCDCYLTACCYSTQRVCICLCAKCVDAKAQDH